MKYSLTLLFFALFIHSATGQNECGEPEAKAYQHGNWVRATVYNNGTLFTEDEGGDPGFLVPYDGENTPATLTRASLCLGGVDEAGHLRLSVGKEGGMWAGPYQDQPDLDEEACKNWDRVFQVSRYEILTHQADLADNGSIDLPILAVLGWPAKGNPYFETIFGFSLPDVDYDLAPFADVNGDGLYSPLLGDYPKLPQSEVIPSVMTYSIFNDALGTNALGSEPLEVEIHQTTWSYYCQQQKELNHTVFSSHRILAKGDTAIDSFRVGFFLDADLGCYTDDYIGTSPNLNTVYSYNADSSDGGPGTCPGGHQEYSNNPPVQAFTSLNYPLYRTIYYNVSGINNPNPITTEPETAEHYYQYLNGRWKDNSPLTFGGLGDDPTNNETFLMFPGNVFVPTQWSLWQLSSPPQYWRKPILSLAPGTLEPQQSITVDMAWIYVRNLQASHIVNVLEMEAAVPVVQAIYTEGFESICPGDNLCTEDCVWPGDANADGVVNSKDLVYLGIAYNTIGPSRLEPNFWSPKKGLTWAANWPNELNYKHADLNGDGIVDWVDLPWLEFYTGYKTPWFQSTPDLYQTGFDLFWEAHSTNNLEELEPGQTYFVLLRTNNVPKLHGISYQIEYDPNIISIFEFQANETACFPCLRRELPRTISSSGKAVLEFAHTKTDGEGTFGSTQKIQQLFRFELNDLPGGLPTSEIRVRIKNILGLDEDGHELDLGAEDLILRVNEQFVSTQEQVGDKDLQVLPNPSSGSFTLTSNRGSIDEVMLYTLDGQEMPIKRQTNGQQFYLQVLDPKPGIYLLSIQMNEQIHYERIIIQ
ncbi:MAG: T9SS type A sorting domain-containing protein [Bacteroidota bacterium]